MSSGRETTVGEAGQRGGKQTLARKGRGHFREIGARGGRKGGAKGGKKGGARLRALVAAGKRAARAEAEAQRPR